MLSLPFDKILKSQIMTAKMMVASLLAFLVGMLLKLDYHAMMWSIITVFVAIDARVESTLILSLTRVIGTAIGVSVSAFLIWYFEPNSLLGMAGCLMVVAIVAGQVQQFGKGVRVAGVAATIVLFMGAMQPTYTQLALDRFLNISLGVACALVASILIFPRHNRKEVAKNTVNILRQIETTYVDLVGTSVKHEEVSKNLANIKSSLEKNRDLLQEIKLAHGKSITEITWLIYCADVLEEVAMHLRAMHEPDERDKQQKMKTALHEELAFSQAVLSRVLQAFSSIIERQG
jgi:uncharacterized membrane protein YccC